MINISIVPDVDSNHSGSATPSPSSSHDFASYRIELITLVTILALVLLVMIIMVLLPKSKQDVLFQCLTGNNPDQSFNYIDVGLYRTRHSMYRKEIYSLAMQRGRHMSNAKSEVSDRLKQQFQLTRVSSADEKSLQTDEETVKVEGRVQEQTSEEVTETTKKPTPQLFLTKEEEDQSTDRQVTVFQEYNSDEPSVTLVCGASSSSQQTRSFTCGAPDKQITFVAC